MIDKVLELQESHSVITFFIKDAISIFGGNEVMINIISDLRNFGFYPLNNSKVNLIKLNLFLKVFNMNEPLSIFITNINKIIEFSYGETKVEFFEEISKLQI
jgi:hypothetical protein